MRVPPVFVQPASFFHDLGWTYSAVSEDNRQRNPDETGRQTARPRSSAGGFSLIRLLRGCERGMFGRDEPRSFVIGFRTCVHLHIPGSVPSVGARTAAPRPCRFGARTTRCKREKK
jgi:hypothetical protein